MSHRNLDQKLELFVGNMTLAIVILDVIFCIEMVISAFEIQDRELLFGSKILVGKHKGIRSTMLFPFTKIGGLPHYKYLNRHDSIYFSENISKLKKKELFILFLSKPHLTRTKL